MRAMILILILLVKALGTTASGVSVEWVISGRFDDASVKKGAERHADLVCQFTQKGDALEGSCRPATGPEGIPIAGTVRAERVEWHFEIALGPNAKKQTATYTCTLNDAGTVLKGTFSIAELRGQFTAEKQ